MTVPVTSLRRRCWFWVKRNSDLQFNHKSWFPTILHWSFGYVFFI